MLVALAERPEIKCLAPYSAPRLFSYQARLLSGVEQINQAFNGTPAGRWTGADEVVAVFDSGIDKTHPDFDGQLTNSIAYQFQGKFGTADDNVGHGTHVCGIIAGTGKASGSKIRGLAPGAKLLSIGIVGARRENVDAASTDIGLDAVVVSRATAAQSGPPCKSILTSPNKRETKVR
jgi:subtilisin family serine protease